MRITTLLRQLIGVITLHVRGLSFEDHGLVLQVVPRWRKPRCGACEKRAPGYDQSRARRWRHLGLGRMRIWLEYAPRRVQCPRCGVRSEQVPWAAQGSRFTWDFEELVAYLAQGTDKTRLTELMGISWTTLGAIVERVVARRLDPSRLEGLRRIGVDEFSYRKRHRYVTTVVDHDRRRVVWGRPPGAAQRRWGRSSTRWERSVVRSSSA